MCLADGATQACGGPRDSDHMNMVWHQAICADRDLLCVAKFRHELEVVLVVFLDEERLLPAVSPLGDKVGHSGSYHTRQSSHGWNLIHAETPVKGWVWCHWNSGDILQGFPHRVNRRSSRESAPDPERNAPRCRAADFFFEKRDFPGLPVTLLITLEMVAREEAEWARRNMTSPPGTSA